jgi:deoxyadenosine/deoxycytidine kinase
MEPVLISIEGNIAAGKSTLLRWFKSVHITIIKEKLEDWIRTPRTGTNLLKEQYENPGVVDFTFAVTATLSRAEQLRETENNGMIQIMERSIHSSCMVFGALAAELGRISPVEEETLLKLYDNLTDPRNKLKIQPDIFVYLDTDPEICFARMKKRCRLEEFRLTLEDLHRLKRQHDKVYLDNRAKLPGKLVHVSGNGTLMDLRHIHTDIMAEIKAFQNKKLADKENMARIMTLTGAPSLNTGEGRPPRPLHSRKTHLQVSNTNGGCCGLDSVGECWESESNAYLDFDYTAVNNTAGIDEVDNKQHK